MNILCQWIDKTSVTTLQPVLFIRHGSPMNTIETNPYIKALEAMGKSILEKNRPLVALVVSAHCLTRSTLAQKPGIIYDYGVFPDELYKV